MGEEPSNYTDLVSNDPHFDRADRVVKRWWQHHDRPARIIWITVGGMATIGGALGFAQSFVPNEPLTIGLSNETQANLLEMVAKGQLTPKQAQDLAIAMTGQAFPDSTITSFADLPENSEKQRYAEAVRTIAESRDSQRRITLAKIGNDDSRAVGLAELASLAKTPEHWREVGELAAPWNAALAVDAYEQVIASQQSKVWDHIYLGRLYVSTGQTEAAAAIFSKGLTLNPNTRDRMVLFNEKGITFTLQGNLPEARKHYDDGLTIARDLATADPSNAEFQRDLIVSYWKLASLGGDDALDHWRAAREVVSALESAGKLRPVDAYMPARIDAEIAKLGG